MDPTYYANLPKKNMGAGALFFNEAHELLLLYPTYKPGFEIPGGVIEKNESPAQAAMREIFEELGIHVTLTQLLCLDYSSAESLLPDSIMFIFYGGIISTKTLQAMNIDANEIKEIQFIPMKHASERKELEKIGQLGKRIVMGLQALENNTCYYLENGEIV